jgi:hypothetical protein
MLSAPKATTRQIDFFHLMFCFCKDNEDFQYAVGGADMIPKFRRNKFVYCEK